MGYSNLSFIARGLRGVPSGVRALTTSSSLCVPRKRPLLLKENVIQENPYDRVSFNNEMKREASYRVTDTTELVGKFLSAKRAIKSDYITLYTRYSPTCRLSH